MCTITFNPRASLIIHDVKLEHTFSRVARMALDTGASITVITPKIAYRLGFAAEDLIPTSYMTTATRTEKVSEVKLLSVSLGDQTISNLEARVFNLPDELKIDGLMGLNFLRHFNITLNFAEGILGLERIK